MTTKTQQEVIAQTLRVLYQKLDTIFGKYYGGEFWDRGDGLFVSDGTPDPAIQENFEWALWGDGGEGTREHFITELMLGVLWENTVSPKNPPRTIPQLYEQMEDLLWKVLHEAFEEAKKAMEKERS